MPFRPRWLAAPVFILVALLATPLTPTSAQSDPFDAEISKAQDQVASTRAQAHAASARLESAAAQRQAVEARVVAVEARVAELAIQIPALKSQIEELRRVLETRAVALYSIGGPAALYGPISFTPSLKAVRRRILADAAARQDNATVKKIEGVLVQLSEAERQLAVEKSTLAAQQAELIQLEASLAAQQVELDRRVAAANAALERAHRANNHLTAVLFRNEPVLHELGLDAVGLDAGLVDLVDRHDDRHLRRLGMVNSFQRLRHNTVIRRHYQNHNVRYFGAAGTHAGKRFVARRIDEDDLIAVLLHVIRANVLRNTAGFPARHIRRANRVQQRGLTVIHVTHDGDDWGPTRQIFRRFRHFHVLHRFFFVRNRRSRSPEFTGNVVGQLPIQSLVDRGENAPVHQLLDDEV